MRLIVEITLDEKDWGDYEDCHPDIVFGDIEIVYAPQPGVSAKLLHHEGFHFLDTKTQCECCGAFEFTGIISK
jgi:hypothetical protein